MLIPAAICSDTPTPPTPIPQGRERWTRRDVPAASPSPVAGGESAIHRDDHPADKRGPVGAQADGKLDGFLGMGGTAQRRLVRHFGHEVRRNIEVLFAESETRRDRIHPDAVRPEVT